MALFEICGTFFSDKQKICPPHAEIFVPLPFCTPLVPVETVARLCGGALWDFLACHLQAAGSNSSTFETLPEP